ncbi:Hypothetical protein D9617_21g097290 [Elsinoe fawcettii]|nr:Hypothetical protein D9617_21g097290 [Elsinoe fawcettii]
MGGAIVAALNGPELRDPAATPSGWLPDGLNEESIAPSAPGITPPPRSTSQAMFIIDEKLVTITHLPNNAHVLSGKSYWAGDVASIAGGHVLFKPQGIMLPDRRMIRYSAAPVVRALYTHPAGPVTAALIDGTTIKAGEILTVQGQRVSLEAETLIIGDIKIPLTATLVNGGIAIEGLSLWRGMTAAIRGQRISYGGDMLVIGETMTIPVRRLSTSTKSPHLPGVRGGAITRPDLEPEQQFQAASGLDHEIKVQSTSSLVVDPDIFAGELDPSRKTSLGSSICDNHIRSLSLIVALLLLIVLHM